MLIKIVSGLSLLILAYFVGRYSADAPTKSAIEDEPKESKVVLPSEKVQAKAVPDAELEAPVIAPAQLRPRKARLSKEHINRRVRNLRKIDPSAFPGDDEISRIESESHQPD